MITAIDTANAGQTNSISGTLLVYLLNVQSSYARNKEEPATKYFDTLQWWIGNKGTWRTKTFAIDTDIHPYFLGTNPPENGWIALAKENTKTNYGDITNRVVEVKITEGLSSNQIEKVFMEHGLTNRFDLTPAGYLLWLPDERKYKSKTTPEK